MLTKLDTRPGGGFDMKRSLLDPNMKDVRDAVLCLIETFGFESTIGVFMVLSRPKNKKERYLWLADMHRLCAPEAR